MFVAQIASQVRHGSRARKNKQLRYCPVNKKSAAAFCHWRNLKPDVGLDILSRWELIYYGDDLGTTMRV